MYIIHFFFSLFLSIFFISYLPILFSLMATINFQRPDLLPEASESQPISFNPTEDFNFLGTNERRRKERGDEENKR